MTNRTVPALGRALVIGGSLGGLFAGLLLHRAGWDVEVFERSGQDLASRGAGIVTHPELFAALARAGVSTHAIGVEVPGRLTLDRDGRVLGERALRQTLTSWDRLYRLLHAAMPPERYHYGKNFIAFEQDEARVTGRFTDGTQASGDLLIGADGIRSTVRSQLLPEVKPLYAGYIAWRGLVDERDLSPATHALIFERFGFCLPPREQMLGYPVAGPENRLAPGERRYNFVWYRPADESHELPRLLTGRDARRYDMSIPPDLIHDDVVAEMRRAADAVLAPQYAEIVRLTKQPFFQAIYDLESPRLAFGRVALLGDAAFVGRPHVGMGVTKAAGDAVTLADALSRSGADVAPALAGFEAKRLRLGAAVVRRARHLGAYMQAQIRTAAEREMAERFRTPAAVMAETAVTDGLDA